MTIQDNWLIDPLIIQLLNRVFPLVIAFLNDEVWYFYFATLLWGGGEHYKASTKWLVNASGGFLQRRLVSGISRPSVSISGSFSYTVSFTF